MQQIDVTYAMTRRQAFRAARALRLEGLTRRHLPPVYLLLCLLGNPKVVRAGVQCQGRLTPTSASFHVGGHTSDVSWSPGCNVEVRGDLMLISGPLPARWGFAIPLAALPENAPGTIRDWIHASKAETSSPQLPATPDSIVVDYVMDDALLRQGHTTLIAAEHQARSRRILPMLILMTLFMFGLELRITGSLSVSRVGRQFLLWCLIFMVILAWSKKFAQRPILQEPIPHTTRLDPHGITAITPNGSNTMQWSSNVTIATTDCLLAAKDNLSNTIIHMPLENTTTKHINSLIAAAAARGATVIPIQPTSEPRTRRFHPRGLFSYRSN